MLRKIAELKEKKEQNYLILFDDNNIIYEGKIIGLAIKLKIQNERNNVRY